MIQNFHILEDKASNFEFPNGKKHIYKVVEAWEEVYYNGDWYGMARFKKVHDTDLEIMPVEFSVKLIFHKPTGLFNPVIEIEKYGRLIDRKDLNRKDVETINSWFGTINSVIKNSTEILDTVF
jgi:hypothetical protein